MKSRETEGGPVTITHQDIIRYFMTIPEAINDFDRTVYAEAYNNKNAIRSSNGWYQAFTEDIEDIKKYEKVTVPAIGIGSPDGAKMLSYFFLTYIENFTIKEIEDSGHFIHEEKPEITASFIMDFLN